MVMGREPDTSLLRLRISDELRMNSFPPCFEVIYVYRLQTRSENSRPPILE